MISKLLLLMLFTFKTIHMHSNEKVKWCINSDYVSNDRIIDKASCKLQPCIISTCPYGQINLNKRCVSIDSFSLDFSEMLKLYKVESEQLVPSDKIFNNETFQIVTYKDRAAHLSTHNNCTTQFFKIGKGGHLDGFLLENGSFYIRDPKTILPSGEYIIRITANNQSGVWQPEILLKFAKHVPEHDVTIFADRMFIYGMLTSFVFMLAVIAIVLMRVPRTTTRSLFVSYVANLATTFLLISIRETCLIYDLLYSRGCYALSTIIHFATFSSFMWMDILAFNIWWIIRKLFNPNVDIVKLTASTKMDGQSFAWCCFVAWVPALVYVTIEVCLDEFTEIYGPRFAYCTAGSSPWFLAGPLLPLQILNLTFLGLVIYNLFSLTSITSNYAGLKRIIFLCIKISILMGSNWIIDLVLLLFYSDIPDWINYTLKGYNSLFGVVLFLAVVFHESQRSASDESDLLSTNETSKV